MAVLPPCRNTRLLSNNGGLCVLQKHTAAFKQGHIYLKLATEVYTAARVRNDAPTFFKLMWGLPEDLQIVAQRLLPSMRWSLMKG